MALTALGLDASALARAFLNAANCPPNDTPMSSRKVYSYDGRFVGNDVYFHMADTVHFVRFMDYFAAATAGACDIFSTANPEALALLLTAPKQSLRDTLSPANLYKALFQILSASDGSGHDYSRSDALFSAITRLAPCKRVTELFMLEVDSPRGWRVAQARALSLCLRQHNLSFDSGVSVRASVVRLLADLIWLGERDHIVWPADLSVPSHCDLETMLLAYRMRVVA